MSNNAQLRGANVHPLFVMMLSHRGESNLPDYPCGVTSNRHTLAYQNAEMNRSLPKLWVPKDIGFRYARDYATDRISLVEAGRRLLPGESGMAFVEGDSGTQQLRRHHVAIAR
jgi:hypothetical protein